MSTLTSRPPRPASLSRRELSELLDEVEEIFGERRPMLSVPEFSQMTLLHRETVVKMCASGQIPAAQTMRCAPYRIHVREVAAMRKRAA